MHDVIVAGGGPGGSTTAAYLRKLGRSVLVLEREHFPRFHLGESMLPFASDLFRELELFDEIDRRYIHKPGARIIHEELGARFTYYFDTAIQSGRPYAYQVQRGDFDQLLLDNARDRFGAEVRERHEVRSIEPDASGVTVRVRDVESGREWDERAKFFVDATGRDALMATKKGLKRPDELVTTNVACFTHYEDAHREPGDDEGNFTLILFDGGWWWFIPFKGNVTSVGVVFEKSYTKARKGMSPTEMFDEAVANQKEIRAILDGAKRVRPVDTTGNWSYRSERFYGERFLMVGDAAAFVDPLFSTGVLMAMTSGKYGAEAIDEALRDGDFTPARFARYEERALVGADLFKKLVHEFYEHDLRHVLVASSANPTICAVITSLLAGDVYKKAMWQSLVREGFSKLLANVDFSSAKRVRSSRQAGPAKLDA